MAEPIRIGLVFPQLLGTYGDRGNAEVLAWRLRRRGHRAQVVELPAPGAIPAGLDAYMLGGGEDLNQAAAVKLLLGRQGRGLRVALAGGAPALAVCGSLQLLGTTYLDGAGRRGDAAALEPIDPDPGQVLHDARLRAAGFEPPDGGGRRGIPRWRRQRRGSRRWRPPSSRGRAR